MTSFEKGFALVAAIAVLRPFLEILLIHGDIHVSHGMMSSLIDMSLDTILLIWLWRR